MVTEQLTEQPTEPGMPPGSATTTRTVPRQAQAPAPLVPARDDFTFAAAPATPRRAAAPTAAPAPRRLVWTATAVAVVVLTGFFVLIVSGRVVTEGPVVAVLTRTHGIHLGDLFALGAWALATGGLLASALAATVLRRR